VPGGREGPDGPLALAELWYRAAVKATVIDRLIGPAPGSTKPWANAVAGRVRVPDPKRPGVGIA
jgi:hypothetical protein